MTSQSLWIWPFELEEKIGEGGMGVVYRGRFVKNDRRFAVKLLPADVADKTILARFEREMELLKTLRHPHIVRTFGGVCEDERRFYAMELVEGGTLDELLRSRGGKLRWEQVVEFGLQMCAGLQHAHEHGIVHRDVKPGNFLLTRSGKLKLSDFGLATVVAGSRLTSAGRTAGTLRYMSPEQVRGRPEVSPRSDLYSLGCVLFEMLTGRTPFDGNSPAEVMNKHLTAAPPRVAEFAPDCPAGLDQLVASLLGKVPQDRPASATEVAQRLGRMSLTVLAGAETVAVPAAGPSAAQEPAATAVRLPRVPAWLLAALILLAALLIVWNVKLLERSHAAARAEELWIEAYEEGDRPVKLAAAHALGRLGRTSERAVEALSAGLSDGDPRVRSATVAALGEAGSNARRVAPKLMKMQREETEPGVRSEVDLALKKIRDSDSDGSSRPMILLLAFLAVAIAGGAWFWKKRRQPVVPDDALKN